MSVSDFLMTSHTASGEKSNGAIISTLLAVTPEQAHLWLQTRGGLDADTADVVIAQI